MEELPKVYNWQLGRKMEYKYEESRPKRQFAAVFDTNKCIACQTCTIACKTTWTFGRGQEYMFWNNVESKPYGFYPLGWDVRLLEILGSQKWNGESYQGKTIFETAKTGEEILGFLPENEDWAYPNLGEDETAGGILEKGMYINTLPHPIWFFYLPRICNHCTYPACLAACPRKAIYKREEDGVVLIDLERCRGYRECVRGCPYKKPMSRANTGVSEKCIACYPKMEQGLQNQCMEMCIGKIRLQGWINTPENAREDNPIDYLVHIRKVALPLYPQFGTEPNVYYIPPIHVPNNYLKQMFGTRAASAVSVYKNAKDDEKILGLLTLFGSTPYIVESFKVKGGETVGFHGGKEVVRVPIIEPTMVRPSYDERLKVYRLDIT